VAAETTRSAWRSFGNPTFRAHLIWVVTGTTAALLLLASAVVLVPLFVRFDAAGTAPQELGRLADRILALHETLWPFLALCVVAVFLSSWLLLQRMVSPLVRYVQTFRAIRDGSLPGPLRLRAADYLTQETEALNEMTAALRERQRAALAAEETLRDEIDELAAWSTRRGDPELANRVADLQERSKRLSDELRRVTLG
jgi:methyl-accepting chemotaxis protein